MSTKEPRFEPGWLSRDVARAVECVCEMGRGHKLFAGRPLVIVESPFAGRETEHLEYLRRCLRDSWERGELPFASHGYFPFFLHESKPEERKQGIEAGYAFWPLAERIVFYLDLGMSPGMQKAYDKVDTNVQGRETRFIGV